MDLAAAVIVRSATYSYDLATGRPTSTVTATVRGRSGATGRRTACWSVWNRTVRVPVPGVTPPAHWRGFGYAPGTRRVVSVTSPEGRIEYDRSPDGQLEGYRTSPALKVTFVNGPGDELRTVRRGLA